MTKNTWFIYRILQKLMVSDAKSHGKTPQLLDRHVTLVGAGKYWISILTLERAEEAAKLEVTLSQPPDEDRILCKHHFGHDVRATTTLPFYSCGCDIPSDLFSCRTVRHSYVHVPGPSYISCRINIHTWEKCGRELLHTTLTLPFRASWPMRGTPRAALPHSLAQPPHYTDFPSKNCLLHSNNETWL